MNSTASTCCKAPAYRAIACENLSVWSKRVTAMCTRLIRFEGEQILPGDRPRRTAPAGCWSTR